MDTQESTLTTQEETTPEIKNPKSLIEKYQLEIDAYNQSTKRWYKQGDEIVKCFKNEKGKVRYNIEWSTIQMLQPTIYARTPKPEVDRRFKDPDRVARLACELLQRCLKYEIETQRFDDALKAVRDDYLLAGRGSAWVRYTPLISTGEGGEEYVKSRSCLVDHIYWKDFGYNICRSWKDVSLLWGIIYLTKDEAVKEFGKIAKKLTYTTFQDNAERASEEAKSQFRKACIYEVWDLARREVFWVGKGYKDDFLRAKKDPLGLKGFFPCPKPLFATIATDVNIPTPDFVISEDIVKDLDLISQRIALITEAIKAAGLTDKNNYIDLKKLFDAAENEIVPIPNFSALKQQGGTNAIIEWMPIRDLAEVLGKLYEAKAQLEQDYYKIRGISDIARGFSSPYETAAAQQIKGAFTNLRLTDRQQEMQRFIADIFQIMAEVIAEHYPDEEIIRISGADLFPEQDKQLLPQALQLLRDEVTRNFKIQVESDSTLAFDDQAEKASMNEYITAVGQFLSQSAQLSQGIPALKPVMFEMLKMAARRYRTGRVLESVLEDGLNQALEEAKQAAQQPPPPSPEQMKVQIDQMKAQAKAQIDAQKLEAKTQLEQTKIQAEQQTALMQQQLQSQIAERDAQIQALKVQSDIALKQQKLELSTELQREKVQLEFYQNELQAKKELLLQVGKDAKKENGSQEKSRPQASPPINITANIVNPERKIGKLTTLPNGDKMIEVRGVE